MDLSSLFRETARRCFPKAEIVADSFHVVHEAKKRLSDWFMAVNAADIGEFTECARTYADWMEEILNIFRTGLSNGYTEGCNNRIKVIKRNAYGMRNFERFRKRILHCMSS